MKGQILFLKINHSHSVKKFSESDTIKMFLIDNIFVCLIDVFFNRQLAYLMEQIVLLF